MSSYFQKNNPKRQKLVPDRASLAKRGLGFGMAATDTVPVIHTLESLKEHLQIAIELEHSTIPPYLCALYTIKEGTNLAAVHAIKSVVIEEMLHMIMAANILNAIGGKPQINTEHFIPKYPGPLIHSSDMFTVNLEKFSESAIDAFLLIEKPAPAGAPPQAHNYDSIGQFYAAIMQGLEYVYQDHLKNKKENIFKKEFYSRQVTSEQYYGSGGKLVAVYNLDDANLAMDEIVGQGEGIDGTIIDSDAKLFGEDIEYAHYFKFNEIKCQQAYLPTDSANEPPNGPKLDVDYDAVHNMMKNPKMKDYKKNPELYNKAYEFNKTYMALLDNIHHACNGQPDLLMKGVVLMYDLKYKALELLNIPTGKRNEVAGPTFEYVK